MTKVLCIFGCVLMLSCCKFIPKFFLPALPSQSINVKATSSEELTHLAQALPEQFVSIGIKDKKGGFKHLIGGVLIYPGVVLTSMQHASSYYEKLYSFNLQDYKGNLWIAFYPKQSNGSPSYVLIKVDKIKHRSNPQAKMFNYISLVFFTPNPQIDNITPTPLATTKDIAFIDDIFNDHLYLVGAVGYPKKYLNQNQSDLYRCPILTYSQLTSVDVDISQRDSWWIDDLSEAFPGKLKNHRMLTQFQQLLENPQHKFTIPLGIKNDLTVSLLFMLLRNSGDIITRYSPIHSKPTPAPLQCAEHLGYPVLWSSSATKHQEKKLLAVTWLSLYVGGDITDLHLPPPILPESKAFSAIHHDIIYNHKWMKKTIESYYKKEVLGVFDDFLDQVFKSTEHQEFLVSFVKYEQNTGYFNHFCHGALIEKNVVVTAAHCLDDYYKNNSKKSDGFVLLKDKNGIYHRPIIDIKIYPEYKREFNSLSEFFAAKRVDIGLVFFEESPITEKFDRLDWTKNPLKTISSKKQEITIWSLAKHDRELRSKGFSEYRWLSYSPIFSIEDFLEKRLKDWSRYSVDKKNSIKKIATQFTEKEIVQSEFKQRLFDYFSSKYMFFPLLSICADEHFICLYFDQGANRLDRHSPICGGSSGSPVFVKNSDNTQSLVGILVANAHFSNAQTCKDSNSILNLAPFRTWINHAIASYSAKTH